MLDIQIKVKQFLFLDYIRCNSTSPKCQVGVAIKDGFAVHIPVLYVILEPCTTVYKSCTNFVEWLNNTINP